jgi:hypothetical protein
MFIHSVYYWLRPDLTADQHATFHAGVQALTTIETVQQAYCGVPAPIDRPVIEWGYSMALIVLFRDQVAHDQYQEHPIHHNFREQCSALWSKVVVYDIIC